MVIIEHYLRLFTSLPEIKVGENREISISQVSEILFCTDRNSRLILKRFEEENWIEWIPGKGRGNLSTIGFLVEPSNLVLRQAREFVKKGNIREAKKIIEDYTPQYTFLKSEFSRWFNTFFGFHNENEEKDTLRLKLSRLPILPLDPQKVTMRSECHIVQHVCDTLVTFDKETGHIIPHLAFYWETNDQRIWTFYLRKGVMFHNGRPLNAEDVVFTFKRLMDENENIFYWMVEDIDSVRYLNDYAIEIVLKAPNHFLLNLLCDEHLSILSSQLGDETIDSFLIGTGPYKLIRNDDSALVMEAHDAYFRERPFLDRVEYWYSPESDEIREPLEANELWFGMYPQQQMGRIAEHRKKIAILEWNVQFLSVNLKKDGPLIDSTFRKALRVVVDPTLLIQELAGDRGQVAAGFLPQEHKELIAQTDNIELLLKESGYTGETLQLYTFDDWDHHEDVKWIVDRCKLYGIVVRPTFLNDKDLLRKEIIQKADIIHDSATMSDQIEVSFLHLILADNSFIKNHLPTETLEKMKAMVRRFYGAPSKRNRLKILQDMQQILLDKEIVIPLYRNEAHVHSDRMVQNVIVNTQGWIDFRGIWFKKGGV